MNAGYKLRLVQGDKMNSTVGFMNCFLRVPLAAISAALFPAAKASKGTSQNMYCLPNLTVQLILSLSMFL